MRGRGNGLCKEDFSLKGPLPLSREGKIASPRGRKSGGLTNQCAFGPQGYGLMNSPSGHLCNFIAHFGGNRVHPRAKYVILLETMLKTLSITHFRN